MSKTQSIDGLQRRKPATTKSIPIKKVSTSTTKSTRSRRSVGIEKPTKSEEKARKKVLKEQETPEDKAVKDFLAEIKDSDPTDLTDIPQRERKLKKAKKPKKSHKKRNIILFILLLLIGGGIFAYLKLNGIYSQINGGNLLSALLAPDTPLQRDQYGRTNILVFGTEGYSMDDPNWDGGYLTDSMMVISLDQDTGDAKAVSLPRDLKTKTCTSTGKLNEAYWCKYLKDKDEAAGVAALDAAFEEVLGLDVQYYVHVNWQALVQVIDTIGGIDVVFTYGDQTWDGDETVIETTDKRGLAEGNGRGGYFYKYNNGEVVHLDGEWALAVARTRNAHGGYGASGGNFSREYFQQKIIEAAAKKAKSSNLTADWNKAFSILQAVGDNVRMNFKDEEMKTLLKLGDTLNIGELQSISLVDPDDGSNALLTTGMINGISYVYPVAGVGNYTNIHRYIRKKLSDSFESEDAQVIVLNGTSSYGIAANEKTVLEDEGFVVKTTANAPAALGGFDGVRVYQLNDKMPKTTSKLAEYYDTDLITDIPEELKNYSCDFIVIIGSGYQK